MYSSSYYSFIDIGNLGRLFCENVGGLKKVHGCKLKGKDGGRERRRKRRRVACYCYTRQDKREEGSVEKESLPKLSRPRTYELEQRAFQRVIYLDSG